MKQVALTAISVQASPEEIKELKELFKALDINGDGSLSNIGGNDAFSNSFRSIVKDFVLVLD